MLPGVCPSCGLKADLEVFAAQAEVRQALAAALRLPAPLGRRALAYLRLFAPEHKSLALAKAGRLLAELQAAVAAGQVRRHGMDRAAPLALWEHALDLIADRPPDGLPLRDHAYLFQIVWTLSEKAAARQEQAGEDQRRHRPAAPAAGVGETRGVEEAPPALDLDRLAEASRRAFDAQCAQHPVADGRPTTLLSDLVKHLTGRPLHADLAPAPQELSPECASEDPHRQEGTVSGR